MLVCHVTCTQIVLLINTMDIKHGYVFKELLIKYMNKIGPN